MQQQAPPPGVAQQQQPPLQPAMLSPEQQQAMLEEKVRAWQVTMAPFAPLVACGCCLARVGVRRVLWRRHARPTSTTPLLHDQAAGMPVLGVHGRVVTSSAATAHSMCEWAWRVRSVAGAVRSVVVAQQAVANAVERVAQQRSAAATGAQHSFTTARHDQCCTTRAAMSSVDGACGMASAWHRRQRCSWCRVCVALAPPCL
jgi:hypothetical protein